MGNVIIDTLIDMDTPPANPVECVCGYSLSGLDHNDRCPECGQQIEENILNDARAGRIDKLEYSWRHCGSQGPKWGFCFSVCSLILGLANSCLAIYFMITLLGASGFGGGFAGIVVLFAPLIWVCIQIPVAILSVICILTGSRSNMCVTMLIGRMVRLRIEPSFKTY